MTATHPSESALREFGRPFARGKWFLLIVVLAAIGGATGYSISQRSVYSATATIGFQDVTPDLAVTGTFVASSRTPEQIALAGADVVRSPTVLARVRKLLGPGAAQRDLLDQVGTNVDAVSDVVEITAQAPSARGAQRRANAFANATVAVANEQSHARYTEQAAALRKHEPSRAKVAAETLSAYDEQLGRLQALGAIAPARLVASALTPQTSISPTPITNALGAALLALVLGLALVLLRDSLDHRVHSPSEIETEVGLAVIGRLRDEALGARPGEKPELSLGATDWEQFRIIRRNLQSLDVKNPLSSIAVASSLPGEGKTTVALFLALASAAAGQRTLLIECDLRRPAIAERVPGIQPSPGVTDFVAGHRQVAEILQPVRLPLGLEKGLVRPTSDVACITAGSATEHPAEVLGSARFGVMLDSLRSAYDVIVLDTSPLLPFVEARELLPRVEAVIFCARARWATREQIRAGRAEIDRLHEQVLGLVVTGTAAGEVPAYQHYAYAA